MADETESEPVPEQPRWLTTGQLFVLERAARAVVDTLDRVKKRDWTAGERHLRKRCEELLAVIVRPELGKPPK